MATQGPHLDHSWRKDTVLPVGRGYGVRSGKPTAIVIHTTNSPKQNTAFHDEAEYLQKSFKVSAHYLVGKQGQIAQILHPDLEAWHAGVAVAAFDNEHSIGIEAHVSQGEQWTVSQRGALTWLVRWLMALYGIPAEMIQTHRAIALPVGRKSDPEGWDNTSFYQWRASLAPQPPVSPPPDPFDAWGNIGRPEGVAREWAIPRAWLVNKRLGRCVQPERYSASGKYSIAEFENGLIYFLKARNVALVELF